MQIGSNAIKVQGRRIGEHRSGHDIGLTTAWRTSDLIRLALHVLVMFGYILANGYANKLMFGVLVPWFAFEMIQRRRPADKKSIILIVGAGLLIFGSKAFAYLDTGAVPNDILLRECVMIATNNILWAAIVAITVDSIRKIWWVLFAYAALRSTESGVGGLLVYFLPERFFHYSFQFLTIDDQFDEDGFLENKAGRLFGFFTHDSVNTGVHLAVAIGILICVLFSVRSRMNAKVLSVPLIAVASTALLFSWSRTGWLAVALFLIVYFYMSGRRIGPLLFITVVSASVAYFARESVSERLSIDSRLAGVDSIEMRFVTHFAYLSNFQSYGLFGIGLARGAIPNALSLPLDMSSEQCFIQAFAETGLIGGGAFVYLLGRGLYALKTSMSACRGEIAFMKETGLAILGIFLIFLIQANTCLITYNDGMFWFLAGFALAFKAIVSEGPGWISRPSLGGAGRNGRNG